MNHNNQLIMVVKKEVLFGKDYFEGFRGSGEIDYEARILANFEYQPRQMMEQDFTYKQPIAYVTVVNPTSRTIFTYQRSTKDADYPETRLQGQWSWGVGGHIEPIDQSAENPIYASMLRELENEVEMNGRINKSKILGYINYDSCEVGKAHFGILCLIETDSNIVKPRNPELKSGGLITIDELKNIYVSSKYTIEPWSRIAFGLLKAYFGHR